MSPNPDVLVFSVLAIALVVFVALLSIPIRLLVSQSRTRSAFAELGRWFGAAPGGYDFGFEVAGRRVAVSLYTPGKSEPMALRVAIAGAGSVPSAIVMRRERWLDRLGKGLGIDREVQVGDPGFDGAVYIDTRASDEVVLALLADEGRRRAVVAILALGFTQVEVGESSAPAWATGPRHGVAAVRLRPDEAQLSPHAVWQAAHALLEIAAGAPAGVGAPEKTWGWAKTVAWSVGLLVALVGGVGALGLAIAAWDAFPPIGSSPVAVLVAAGGGAYVALIPVAALVLRGRSDSLRRLGVAVAVGAYVVPCYTAALLLTLNGALDDSRPARAESRVLGRWITTGKNPQRKIRLAGIRGGEAIELTVDAALYGRLAEGGAVTVVTGEGALGWRWVQRVEPAKAKARR